jgi:hypothetical protein
VRQLIETRMHLAKALARRRRYAACLITSDHEKPRFFGLACRGIALPRVFCSAGGRFAVRHFARSLETAFLFGGASFGLLTSLFASSLASGLKVALLFGFTGGSFAACFFTRRLTSGLKATFLFSLAGSSFTARFFSRGLTRSFEAALIIGSAGGGLAARFPTRGLTRGLTNGVKPALLFGIARRRIARCCIAPHGIAALVAASPPRRRSFASGMIAPRLITATLALARLVPIPFAARPAVPVAPVRFGLEFTLPWALVAVVATRLAVRVALVSDVVSGLVSGRLAVALAAWRRRPSGHGRLRRALITWIVGAALSDHPVEPLIDRHVDALRRVALSLARLRTEASQIPRTARLHPRAQTTSGGPHPPPSRADAG